MKAGANLRGVSVVAMFVCVISLLGAWLMPTPTPRCCAEGYYFATGCAVIATVCAARDERLFPLLVVLIAITASIWCKAYNVKLHNRIRETNERYRIQQSNASPREVESRH